MLRENGSVSERIRRFNHSCLWRLCVVKAFCYKGCAWFGVVESARKSVQRPGILCRTSYYPVVLEVV